MNYTEKYRLPQWDKTDRILMNDFNQMCLDLETAIEQTALDAAGDSAKAQTTAENALARANAAQSTANNAYSPSQMPYKVGTYVGNGDTLSISLGFRPSFVIVSAQRATSITNTSTNATKEVAVVGPANMMGSLLAITDSGITVSAKAAVYPHLNTSGTTYDYIAFR